MDRRHFISSAGLLSAITLVPCAAVAATPAVSVRLQRLIALHDRADAACTRYIETVEEPARREWRAEVDAYPAEPPPPHEEAATTFVNYEGDTIRLSTEKPWLSGVAHRVVNDLTWTDMGDDDWRQAHVEIHAAFTRRDAALAAQAGRRKAFEADARRRCRLDAILARSEGLDDRRYQLWQAITDTPATSLPDLALKLKFFERTDEDDQKGEVFLPAIRADVRRLVGAQS